MKWEGLGTYIYLRYYTLHNPPYFHSSSFVTTSIWVKSERKNDLKLIDSRLPIDTPENLIPTCHCCPRDLTSILHTAFGPSLGNLCIWPTPWNQKNYTLWWNLPRPRTSLETSRHSFWYSATSALGPDFHSSLVGPPHQTLGTWQSAAYELTFLFLPVTLSVRHIRHSPPRPWPFQYAFLFLSVWRPLY